MKCISSMINQSMKNDATENLVPTQRMDSIVEFTLTSGALSAFLAERRCLAENYQFWRFRECAITFHVSCSCHFKYLTEHGLYMRVSFIVFDWLHIFLTTSYISIKIPMLEKAAGKSKLPRCKVVNFSSKSLLSKARRFWQKCGFQSFERKCPLLNGSLMRCNFHALTTEITCKRLIKM